MKTEPLSPERLLEFEQYVAVCRKAEYNAVIDSAELAELLRVYWGASGDRSLAARMFRETRIITLEAEVGRLRTEISSWQKERDFLRRGILELYHGELITMSRARELMGFTHIDPVRELYRALKPEFERDEAGVNDG